MDMETGQVIDLINEVIDELEAEYTDENPDLDTVRERLLEGVAERELEVDLINIVRAAGIEQVQRWIDKERKRR